MATTSTSQTNTQGYQSTGDPTYDAVLQQLSTIIQSKLANGQNIDPNNAITPALAAQFLNEATTQLDPELQQYLTSNISDINASLQNAQQQYENQVGTSNQAFQQGMQTERNSAATDNTAGGSADTLAQQQLINQQNRNLSSLSSQAQADIGTTLRAGGNEVGQGISGLNGNQSNFAVPNIQTSSVTGGGGNGQVNQGSNINFSYNPNNYPTGTLGSQALTEIGNTQANIQSNYLGQVGANYGNTPSLQSLNNPTKTNTTTPGSTSYQNLNSTALS